MQLISAVSLCGLLLLMPGCSSREADRPEIGAVTGTVTMEGKPFPHALVVFAPEAGRSSTAVTDDQGIYNLLYLTDVPGAKVGSHVVMITTFLEDEDNPANAKFKETVPTKYNTKSTLTADVKSGKNTIDFELKKK